MQALADKQWELLEPLLVRPTSPKGGRPRVPDRPVLDGILWILKTGAQWNELPNRYPPYQTCHRRYSEWVRAGKLAEILKVLAQDMEERGGISLEECFIDGTFAGAKKGALVLVLPSVVKGPNSWSSAMEILFRSPSTWEVLLRMKSPWWKQRLPKDLRKRLQYAW